MQLAVCDLRLPIDAVANVAVAAGAPAADLFLFSFVLHENAGGLMCQMGGGNATGAGTAAQAAAAAPQSVVGGGGHPGVGCTDYDDGGECEFLRPDARPGWLAEGARIGGCLAGIFRVARVGAVVVAMDAANWLWPAVAATAAPLGWAACTPRVKYGPGSAIVLHRTSLGLGDALSAPTPVDDECR
jgi:hypothetical protein